MLAIYGHVHAGRRLTAKADGYKSLLANYVISQFATNLIGMFGVVFVYQLADSLVKGLIYITLYFGAQRLVVYFSTVPVGHMIAKFGYRKMMIFGLICLSVKLYLLSLVTASTLWLLFPSLLLGGVMIPSYFLAFHALFLDDNDDAKLGEQMGFMAMLGRATGIIAPFAAGVIVEVFGFSVLFSLATFLLTLSFIPLVMMKHHKRHFGKFSLPHVIESATDFPEFTQSMYWWTFTEGIQAFLWPIYLSIVLGDYAVLGIVGSLVAIVNSISVYLFGRAYDGGDRNKLFTTFGVLVSLSWFARFISTTPVGVSVSDVLNRSFSPAWWSKIRRYELIVGEKVDGLVFGAAHELILTMGMISGLISGFVILIITKQWIWLTIPSVLGTLLATRTILQNEKKQTN